MCGPLCDAVMLGEPTGAAASDDSSSQLVLEQLERANLFVVPLDDARRWYRYHHLFGEMLCEQLVRGATRVEAIAPVRALGHMMATLNGYTSLATLQVLQGRLHAAAATYAEVERLGPGQDALPALSGSPSYYFCMGDLLRERNDLDAAEAYLSRGMEFIQGTLATEAEVILGGYLTLARLQQARGNDAVAIATLETFVQLYASGERKRALKALERALVLAAHEGYRVFIDEGAPLAALLAQSMERKAQNNTIRTYAGHLLFVFSAPSIVVDSPCRLHCPTQQCMCCSPCCCQAREPAPHANRPTCHVSSSLDICA